MEGVTIKNKLFLVSLALEVIYFQIHRVSVTKHKAVMPTTAA